ncbi:GNAT family N-acetyltransferase [Haloferula sp.]|uniref:GNAT family N-acetyltransferase n=1 Tax=Haloferula sp. TaxID=2497595 RepID=UPI00329B054A
MSECDVRPLGKSDYGEATRLLGYLNPDCTREVLVERFQTIIAESPHYHPFGVFIGDEMVAFAGAWIATKVWCGRYLEIDNIVVHPDHRSSGLGTKLIKHCEHIATERGCNLVVLDSYTTNHPSHRLYQRLGFEIWGFHFVKQIASLQR